MPSYYYPQLDKVTQEVILENEEFHHLSRVKRIAPGARIKLNGGNGILAEAEVVEISKHKARLLIIETIEHPAPSPRFAIAISLLKNHHDELAVEKCTELGAAEFFPMITEFTVKDAGKNTVSRLEKIALAALKQCDNPFLPKINPVQDLDETLARIREHGYQAVLCSEVEKQNWLNCIKESQPICFVIGPEGGFSEAERATMKHLPSIMINRLIMRAETAAICAASQFLLLREGLLGS